MTVAWTAYDCRRTTRSHRAGRRCVRTAVPGIELAAVLDPGHLHRVMTRMASTNGQAPGVDGVRYHDVSKSEWCQLFRDVRAAVLSGTYRPQPLRPVNIPKVGGGTRTLKLAVVVDRVLSKAVADAIAPVAERVFHNCSFGFRPKRDRFSMLADLKVFCETHRLWVLSADDVRKAFDCIPVDRAIASLQQLTARGADPGLIALATVLIRGHTPQEVGIPQGDALSPLLLNLVLHSTLDDPMTVLRDDHDPIRFYRYADNLLTVTEIANEGREQLERTRRLLSETGLSLKGDPGVPRDLHGGDHLDLLGMRLTRSGSTLTFGIPDKKWADLATKLEQAHRTADPTATARSLATGWIEAHAPAYNTDRRTDEETTGRLLNLTQRTRHRHVLTRSKAARLMRAASARWERTLAEARTRMTTELSTNPTPAPGTTAHATAATPTADCEGATGTTGDTTTAATNRDDTGGTTGAESQADSESTTRSSQANTACPSGRFTALLDHDVVPPSASHRRVRSAPAARRRVGHRSSRQRPGRWPSNARPPPRPRNGRAPTAADPTTPDLCRRAPRARRPTTPFGGAGG